MAKSVAFPLLLSKHQGHPLLKKTKHEIVIEINGDTDSLSLQMLYDTAQPVFLRERDALASVIDNLLRDMGNTTNRAKKKKYLEKFTKNSQKRIAKMEASLQKCVGDFIQSYQDRAEEQEIGIFVSTWKYVVRTTWSARKIAVGAAEVFALGASGAGTAAGILKIVDLIRDIIALRSEISDSFKPEIVIRKELLGQLKKIKALRNNRELKKSHVDTVEKTLKQYDFRLKTMEDFTRDLAKKVDVLMKTAPKLIQDNPAKMQKVEKAVDKVLKDITKLTKALKKGAKIRKNAAIQLGMAKKAAKKDGFFTITNLVGIYDSVKDLPDLRENWKEIGLDKIIDYLMSED